MWARQDLNLGMSLIQDSIVHRGRLNVQVLR
jgi:hypothetical protein